MRQSILVPINVNVIKKHGFAELFKAILEAMPSNKSICCDQLMSKNIKYGTQIFIEYNLMEHDIQKKYCLADFPTKIQFSNNTFILGIVARYGGTESGHYVAIAVLRADSYHESQ